MATQCKQELGAPGIGIAAGARVKMPTLACLCAALALVAPAATADGGWQDPQSIRDAALAFARAQAPTAKGRQEIAPRPVDPRLKLRRCDRELEAFAPAGGVLRGNAVVGVRCPGSHPWKVYVPMTVRILAPVAVARGALAAGHRLGAADVRWEERDVARGSAGFVQGHGSPVGHVLKHAVRDGQPLRPHMLRAAKVVRRGERVTLAVNHPTLAIRMAGVALADGATGERIRARNDSSGRVIEGTVRGPGLLEIEIF